MENEKTINGVVYKRKEKREQIKYIYLNNVIKTNRYASAEEMGAAFLKIARKVSEAKNEEINNILFYNNGTSSLVICVKKLETDLEFAKRIEKEENKRDATIKRTQKKIQLLENKRLKEINAAKELLRKYGLNEDDAKNAIPDYTKPAKRKFNLDA